MKWSDCPTGTIKSRVASLMARRWDRPSPEALARELKVVLDVGLRAPKVRSRLTDLPMLQAVSREFEGLPSDSWGESVAVCRSVAAAVDALGNGPYGLAASYLLGTVAATRGLPKWRRRVAAAEALGTEVATFVRHWERDLLLDIAVGLLESTSAFRTDTPQPAVSDT